MAKSKTTTKSTLPPGVSTEPEFVNTPPPVVKKAKPITRTVTIKDLTCSVPCVENVQGYSRNRVDSALTGKQAETLKGILLGLEEKGAKMANGKHVSTQSHVLPWILDQLA